MTTEFAEIESAVKDIDGWLRPEQAQKLWDLAATAPDDATVVEIGSFHGRSTVVLGSAVGENAMVYAIDPHAGNDRGPGEWHGEADDGQADHDAFISNLKRFDLTDRVTHVREFSQKAGHLVPGEIDVLYIDGAHGYSPALSDIVEWGARVRPGGSMAIHDTYTSVFVTFAVMRSLWWTSEWEYLGRERSMTLFRKVPHRLSGRSRFTNLVHQVSNVPWFAKNCVVKGLDAVGLSSLSRLGQGPGGGVY